MYVYVKKRDGSYYKSAAFGIIKQEKKGLFDEGNELYIVLSEDRQNLLVLPFIDYYLPFHLNPRIIFIDHRDEWRTINENFRLAVFLPENIVELIEDGTVPGDIVQKCVEIDAGYPEQEFYHVTTNEEGDNLLWTAGGFHDGYIKEIKEYNDGLYLYFADMWSCDIELWMEGDLQYHIDEDSRPNGDNRWWYDSSIYVADDFVWLGNDVCAEPSEIETCSVWFKARQLKYKILITKK